MKICSSITKMNATRSCGTQIFLANATPPWLLLHFATEKKGFVAFFATKMPQIRVVLIWLCDICDFCDVWHLWFLWQPVVRMLNKFCHKYFLSQIFHFFSYLIWAVWFLWQDFSIFVTANSCDKPVTAPNSDFFGHCHSTVCDKIIKVCDRIIS